MEANDIGEGNRSDLEEATLIQSVVEREGDLIGDLKGTGSKKKQLARREGWDDICGVLNSQYPTAKRVVEEVKKKYFNLKQRAKEKIDAIKGSIRKTGDGPAPSSLTPGEEAMVKSLEGRPDILGHILFRGQIFQMGLTQMPLHVKVLEAKKLRMEVHVLLFSQMYQKKQKRENQEGHLIQKLKS